MSQCPRAAHCAPTADLIAPLSGAMAALKYMGYKMSVPGLGLTMKRRAGCAPKRP